MESEIKNIPGSISKDHVYRVNPKKITLAMKEEFLIHTYRGKIVGGDWDIVPFEEKVDFYDSFAGRIRHNTPWEETVYFKRVMGEIEQGVPKWGCRNREQLLRRCQQLEEIYLDMKKNGYQQNPDMDYIELNIAADGKLIFNNGRHRLTFAKLLDIPEVPVRITVRHPDWMAFREKIETYAETHAGGVYAPLGHPDLSYLNVIHRDRFELLNRHIHPQSKSVLDIGAQWGQMCRMFEESGRQCTAIEYSPVHLFYLDKLRTANQNRFQVVQQDIVEYVKEGRPFDTTLALSVFHHFLKTPGEFAGLKIILNNLKGKEMFIQFHSPMENQMKDAYRNFQPEEFADFILQNTLFEQYREIGDFSGRKMMHFFVSRFKNRNAQ